MTRRKMILIGLLLSIVSIISYWGIIRPNQLSEETSELVASKKNVLKIAVVNEDSGTVYNGQQLNIGELLATSFSSNGNYSIEVVSRAIAERGLENNVYQLMVVLPSNFSQDTLSLESTSPSQAVFQYQIKSNKNYQVKQAEQAVVDLKDSFNRDLIHIYFLSIIENLQTAQGRVSDVVAADGRVLTSYEGSLINPLTLYSQQFTGVSSTPSSLLSAYTSFQQSLMGSNDAFSSIVDVKKVYTPEIDTIQSLQEKWQTSILSREEALKNYDEEFSKLSVEQQLTQLQELNAKMIEQHKNPVVLSDTKAKTSKLQSDITSFLARLRDLNSEIETTFKNHEKNIAEAVEKSLRETDSFDVNQQAETLGSYLQTFRLLAIQEFNEEFLKFQGYNPAVIDRMNISETDRQYLKNLNKFAIWYADQHRLTAPLLSDGTTSQEKHIKEAVEHIKASLAQENSISVEGLKGGLSGVQLIVPVGYELRNPSLPIRSQMDNIYYLEYPSSALSTLSVSYSLEAKPDTVVSILTPLEVQLIVDTNEEFEYQVEVVPNTSTSSLPLQDGVVDGQWIPLKEDPSVFRTNSDGSQWVESDTIHQVEYRTDKKIIEYRSSASETLFPYNGFTGFSLENGAYADFRSYFELASLIQTYYGYEIGQEDFASEQLQIASDSLIGKIQLKASSPSDLQAIIVSIITQSTIDGLKANLKITDADLTNFASLAPEAEKLSENIQTLQENTNQLLDRLGIVVAQTNAVNNTLDKKPVFIDQEKRDNTDLVTVTLSINSDLEKLKNASQTLMEDTKSHQLVSETINGQMERLTSDVKALESEGVQLSNRVNGLHDVMTTEYDDNTEFLKAFSTVLSNTKIGNSPNMAVYDYLSNPVDASNVESVLGIAKQQEQIRQDERSGFLLIFVSYIAAMGASYILSHSDRSKWLLSKTNVRRHWRHSVPSFTFLTTISLLSALLMGVIAGYRLSLSSSQLTVFVILLFVTHQLFAHGISALNDYFKHYGFLVSLLLMLLYLISAGQLLDAYYISHNDLLSIISPLTYLEEMVTAFLNNKEGWVTTFVIVFVLATVVSGVTIYRYQELEE